MLLANKQFNIFRHALVKPKQYGIESWGTDKIDVISEYFKTKGIDIKEYDPKEVVDLILSQDDLAEEFWKTDKVIKYGLSEGLTFKEGAIEFGLRKFAEDYMVEYEDAKKMYELLLENKIGNIEFSPDTLPSDLRETFFSLVEQSMRNQSMYQLDLQEGIDYFEDDIDEENNNKMPKYNMHTKSGKGVSKENIHRIVGEDGKAMSRFDVTMCLCQRYKQLYPDKEFPSIVSSSGYTEELWLDQFYAQYERQISLQELEGLEENKGKSGFEDCMQDDGVKTSTMQTATRTVKDVVLNRTENNREEEKI